LVLDDQRKPSTFHVPFVLRELTFPWRFSPSVESFHTFSHVRFSKRGLLDLVLLAKLRTLIKSYNIWRMNDHPLQQISTHTNFSQSANWPLIANHLFDICSHPEALRDAWTGNF